MLLSIYQDVLLSRHMLLCIPHIYIYFFLNKFGGVASFAPLQAAYMRNIWKSGKGQKNLLEEKILNLSVQKLFSKNTEQGSATLGAFLIKACRHKHLNMSALLKIKYSEG